jgi:hypothetical protein
MNQLAYERALEEVMKRDRESQEKQTKKMSRAAGILGLGLMGAVTAYDYLNDPRNTHVQGKSLSFYLSAMMKAFSGRLSVDDALQISGMFGGDPRYRGGGFQYI